MESRSAQTLRNERTWTAPTQWRVDGSVRSHLDPDQLFADLDGRSVTTPQGVWFVQIQSILDDAEFRWMQLTLAGNQSYSLTFRLNPGDDADEALRNLSMWLVSAETHQVM